MQQSEPPAQAVQREAELQRWADDGGFIPERRTNTVPTVPRGLSSISPPLWGLPSGCLLPPGTEAGEMVEMIESGQW